MFTGVGSFLGFAGTPHFHGSEVELVRELEGLSPGSGPFAQDRIYRKKLQEQKEGKAVNIDKEDKEDNRGFRLRM